MKAVVLLITGFIFCLVQCDGRADITQNTAVKLTANVSPTPKTLPVNGQSQEKKMDKKTLAKRVEPTDTTAAQIIEAENSQIQEIETPFLRDGKIYKVSKFAPTRPIILYVGANGNDYTALIGGNPEKYFEFVEKAKLTLDSKEIRKMYVLNFLEVTKKQNERLQILESAADIKPRPNLSEAEQKEFADFQEKYRSIIKPVQQNESGIYEIFAIKKQDLIRMDLTIKPDGTIDKKETVLESDILIPYAL